MKCPQLIILLILSYFLPQGFKSTEVATLVNTALVPMGFSLRVPGDGEGDVVSATSGEVTLGRSNLSTPAREFQIVPSSGTVDPQSEVKIEVSEIFA